ncbi:MULTISPECIES: tRNA lysidine(34) synthetase TilS [unclassified Sphingomonas]|uniref:tRNA lysidine(34) synthetase TilS n=1 Tax=unclassified Sphingomonas TaxID=196159 RepID=UPI00082CD4D7|nr:MULTISPECIES: tRNA lysidine(34) synthetase TilS [unclassified Sphingomonas]
MTAALDPQAVERFRGDVTALFGRDFMAGDRIGLAVSGGADSMAMLALAVAAWPGQVRAATVDHRLRAAAADEARMVADWCTAHDVPHAILTPRDAPDAGSAQAAARALRYRLLGDWAHAESVIVLLTAHHADDQAETLLMRLARGTGLPGLRGIPAARHVPGEVAVLRPLLGWRRQALRALVEAAAIPFVDDPSNADQRFERARVRALLVREAWLDPDRLARSARALAEVDDELAAITDWLWADRQRAGGDAADCALDLTGLPRELRRRLVRRAILAVRERAGVEGPEFDTATRIESLLDMVESGAPANQGGVLVTPRGAIWQFRTEPSRRSG